MEISRISFAPKIGLAGLAFVAGFLLVAAFPAGAESLDPGYDARWDEWIAADRVVGAGGHRPAKGDQVKVEWQGRWYDARVKSAEQGKWCIAYAGFDASWDECVEEARIRF